MSIFTFIIHLNTSSCTYFNRIAPLEIEQSDQTLQVPNDELLQPRSGQCKWLFRGCRRFCRLTRRDIVGRRHVQALALRCHFLGWLCLAGFSRGCVIYNTIADEFADLLKCGFRVVECLQITSDYHHRYQRITRKT